MDVPDEYSAFSAKEKGEDMRAFLGFIAIVLFLAFPPPATADEFMLNGGSCIPASDVIGQYTNAGGKWGATSGSSTDCWYALPELTTAPSHLYLLYSRTNSQNALGAVYGKMSKADGTFSQIAVVNADVTGAVDWNDVSFSDTYDPDYYIYMITLSVDSTTGTIYTVSVY